MARRIPLAVVIALGLAAPAAAQSKATKGLADDAIAARLAERTGRTDLRLTARETDLLADAADRKLSRMTLAEAALLAGGVTDDKTRQKYLARIDALEADARKAVAAGKTPFEKGERLLKWMHAGPAKKYTGATDDLAELLDRGQFNCLSATTLYNTLGRRLGLDMRSMVGLVHICSIQYDGEDAREVENTNPAGYDPPGRRSKTGRREVDDLGLLAAIYHNRLARLDKAGERPEAVRAAVFVRALDTNSTDGGRDLVKAVRNWFVAEVRANRFADAVAVLDLGLEAAPGNPILESDRRGAYARWLLHHRSKGEWEKGAEVAAAAVAARPNDRLIGHDAETHFVLWAKELNGDPAKQAEVLRKGLAVLPKSRTLKTWLDQPPKKGK